MKVYLAGAGIWRSVLPSGQTRGIPSKFPFNVLMSFAVYDDIVVENIHKFQDFILDSGAFSYLAGLDASKVDWDDYIRRYASFINKYDIEKFIELDIDSIVGYERVKELREKLIKLTGKKPIPVWHKSRGKDEFIKMCKEFPYVAIGGIVTKEITRKEYKFFPWFIQTAHQYGAKIHALGLTNMSAIKKYNFDSVDSSSWTCGNRFGYVVKFNGSEFVQIKAGGSRRLKNADAVAKHNFDEWVRFANHIEGGGAY